MVTGEYYYWFTYHFKDCYTGGRADTVPSRENNVFATTTFFFKLTTENLFKLSYTCSDIFAI
jgi:hypothetical protein